MKRAAASDAEWAPSGGIAASTSLTDVGLPVAGVLLAATKADVAQELARARMVAGFRSTAAQLIQGSHPSTPVPAIAIDEWLVRSCLNELDGVRLSSKTQRRKEQSKHASSSEDKETHLVSDPLLPCAARAGSDGGHLLEALAASGVPEEVATSICKAAAKAAAAVRATKPSGPLVTSPNSGAGGLRIEWVGKAGLVSTVPALASDAAIALAKAEMAAQEARITTRRATMALAGEEETAASDEDEEREETIADPPFTAPAPTKASELPCAIIPAPATGMFLCKGKTRLRLRLAAYLKLGALYRRGPGRFQPWSFHERLFMVLLRYHTMNMTKSIGPVDSGTAHRVFDRDVAFELLTTPFACNYSPFFSLYPDVDFWFGSAGTPWGGAWPDVPLLINLPTSSPTIHRILVERALAGIPAEFSGSITLPRGDVAVPPRMALTEHHGVLQAVSVTKRPRSDSSSTEGRSKRCMLAKEADDAALDACGCLP
jgi:hypothetical protein